MLESIRPTLNVILITLLGGIRVGGAMAQTPPVLAGGAQEAAAEGKIQPGDILKTINGKGDLAMGGKFFEQYDAVVAAIQYPG